jgi:hypothetical protein
LRLRHASNERGHDDGHKKKKDLNHHEQAQDGLPFIHTVLLFNLIVGMSGRFNFIGLRDKTKVLDASHHFIG